MSTDLFSINMQQITLAINLELPNAIEQYLHRIDRFGKYNRKGVVINICDSIDMLKILEIVYNTNIVGFPYNILHIFFISRLGIPISSKNCLKIDVNQKNFFLMIFFSNFVEKFILIKKWISH